MYIIEERDEKVKNAFFLLARSQEVVYSISRRKNRRGFT